jgi:NCS1 family nucleobase:cation symporter-1
LALRHVPGLHKISWKFIISLTCVPLLFFVFWPHELYDMGDAFLAYNGTMHAPVGGILMVDYFFLRKQRLHLRSIFEAAPSGHYYYTRGFNILALACIVIGQATYFLVYNPFTTETSGLMHFLPASIAAFLLPALIYWAGMKFWVQGGRHSRPLDEAGLPGKLTVPNL